MRVYITPEEYKTAKKHGIARQTLERRVRRYRWPKSRATTEPTRKPKKRSLKDLRKQAVIEQLRDIGAPGNMEETLEELEMRLALSKVREVDIECDSGEWF